MADPRSAPADVTGTGAPGSEAPGAEAKRTRKFLVVVDETPECKVALRYAARRAQRTGGSLLLLRVVTPQPGATPWLAVEERMREEAEAETQNLLQGVASEVNSWSGLIPAVTVRHGNPQDEIIAAINEDPGISVLVLGAAAGPQGPGALVSGIAGRLSGSLRVPVTVVSGALSSDDIDALT